MTLSSDSHRSELSKRSYRILFLYSRDPLGGLSFASEQMIDSLVILKVPNPLKDAILLVGTLIPNIIDLHFLKWFVGVGTLSWQKILLKQVLQFYGSSEFAMAGCKTRASSKYRKHSYQFSLICLTQNFWFWFHF